MAKRPQTASPKPSSSKENFPPTKKRFDFTVDDNDFRELNRGFVPQNTSMDTEKCVRLFETWLKERNHCFPENKVPEEILMTNDKERLSK